MIKRNGKEQRNSYRVFGRMCIERSIELRYAKLKCLGMEIVKILL